MTWAPEPGGEGSVPSLRRALLAAASPGGGWPYFGERRPRLESTCWALLALLNAETPLDSVVAHTGFLSRCLQHDGVLADSLEQPANLAFNGLAALLALDQDDPAAWPWSGRVLSAIAATKGLRLGDSPEFVQDNSLRGWPWIDATFSWVEPTAWCLLALKKLRHRMAGGKALPGGPTAAAISERILEAEAVLFDRSCPAGGWNYGNSRAFGQDLRPYVPTTALALIALQDRREHPVFRRGIELLRQHGLEENSGMALGLALVCLRTLGLEARTHEERLDQRWQQGAFLGNVHTTAIAMYALSSENHGASAFRI